MFTKTIATTIAACAGVLLAACTSSTGPTGPAGPKGDTGDTGVPGTTSFQALTDVPAALKGPFPGGASTQIIDSVTVTARADCGSVPDVPHLEVYVDGALIGGTDVTNSTYADTSVFAIDPPRYAHEVAVAFTNDNSGGTCDHNLYVQKITLGTAGGAVEIPASQSAHVVYDKGAYFDSIDVAPATETLSWTGALRFLLGQGAAQVMAASTPIPYAGGALPRSGTFATTGGTVVVFAHASAFSTTPSTTLRVELTIDSVSRGVMRIYANEASSHRALSGLSVVVSGLAPGTHTATLTAQSGTSSDLNDFSEVTVLELPQ